MMGKDFTCLDPCTRSETLATDIWLGFQNEFSPQITRRLNQYCFLHMVLEIQSQII